MEGEQVIAEGIWCLVCQFLEDREDVEGDKCRSCGCPGSTHQPVKVVAV